MNLHARRALPMPLSVTGVWLLFVFGCGNVPGRNALQASATTQLTSAAPPVKSDDPGIDLQCAADRLRKAPAPFHWSFKKVVTPDTNADWEADITANTISGTLLDGSGTRAIHATRSDMTSWNTAVLVLTGPIPASTFAMVDNSSATVRAGTEAMNGENAVRYEIDTSRESAADAYLIKSMLGTNGSIRGSVWVTRDGCPVKFILDVQQSLRDASVQQEHYEANVRRSSASHSPP